MECFAESVVKDYCARVLSSGGELGPRKVNEVSTTAIHAAQDFHNILMGMGIKKYERTSPPCSICGPNPHQECEECGRYSIRKEEPDVVPATKQQEIKDCMANEMALDTGDDDATED